MKNISQSARHLKAKHEKKRPHFYYFSMTKERADLMWVLEKKCVQRTVTGIFKRMVTTVNKWKFYLMRILETWCPPIVSSTAMVMTRMNKTDICESSWVFLCHYSAFVQGKCHGLYMTKHAFQIALVNNLDSQK